MAQLPAAQLKLSVPAAAPDNGASLTHLNSYHNLFCFFSLNKKIIQMYKLQQTETHLLH